MKRIIVLFSISFLVVNATLAQDTLKVLYQENFPMCFKGPNGAIKGVEADILNEYVNWMKAKKSVALVVTYKEISHFDSLYKTVKNSGPKVIGLGMFSITEDRKKDVSFSPPYFKNISVLVSNGKVPTIISGDEGKKILAQMNCITIKNTTLQQYANELAKQIPSLKVTTEDNQQKVLDKIATNDKNLGYVDIISFWYYISKHEHYVKLQKQFNREGDFFGFISPKNFKHQATLNEFFETGFGFTSTKVYHQILENYLGYEIIDLVEVK